MVVTLSKQHCSVFVPLMTKRIQEKNLKKMTQGGQAVSSAEVALATCSWLRGSLNVQGGLGPGSQPCRSGLGDKSDG